MPICIDIPQYNTVKKLYRQWQKVSNCLACMGTLNNSTHIQYVLRSVAGHGRKSVSRRAFPLRVGQSRVRRSSNIPQSFEDSLYIQGQRGLD